MTASLTHGLMTMLPLWPENCNQSPQPIEHQQYAHD